MQLDVRHRTKIAVQLERLSTASFVRVATV